METIPVIGSASRLLDNIPNVPPCDSLIWGHGDLLDAVQRSKIFSDSKTFVDLKLKYPEENVVQAFKNLPNSPKPDRNTLEKFVEDNFSLEQNLEFEDWDPEDWIKHPKYLDSLKRPALIYVGLEVNKLWNFLSKKCSKDLMVNSELYSKIYLQQGFVMPGGRFREIYYWDTYWIVRGLLVSNMFKTVKGILMNFLEQIKRFGHIPNGTRIYYERRTQPPFFTSMITAYVEASNDWEFVRENLDTIEEEIKFYEQHRRFRYKWSDGEVYTVFKYSADCRGPRPESYIEDAEVAEEMFQSKEMQEEFYLHMKAAAESGWDFSSRWFIDKNGENDGTLADAKTCYILPVELNALMFKNYLYLAQFHDKVGIASKVGSYEDKARDMLRTIGDLLWDSDEKMWFDIDVLNNKRRKYFYASNLFPLWVEAYPEHLALEIGEHAVSYLLRTGVTEHLGGIPASTKHTKQQWDWNAWPPLQHLIVSGLNKTKNIKAKKLAFKIAQNYTVSTIAGCNKDSGVCEIFEKYDPTNQGAAGGGGEYEVQMGFGWTNGVLIHLIKMYGDKLIDSNEYEPTQDELEMNRQYEIEKQEMATKTKV